MKLLLVVVRRCRSSVLVNSCGILPALGVFRGRDRLVLAQALGLPQLLVCFWLPCTQAACLVLLCVHTAYKCRMRTPVWHYGACLSVWFLVMGMP